MQSLSMWVEQKSLNYVNVLHFHQVSKEIKKFKKIFVLNWTVKNAVLLF